MRFRSTLLQRNITCESIRRRVLTMKGLFFVKDGQILSGRSLKLQTSGDHDIQVFPDKASWQRWRSANSGKGIVSTRGQVAGS